MGSKLGKSDIAPEVDPFYNLENWVGSLPVKPEEVMTRAQLKEYNRLQDYNKRDYLTGILLQNRRAWQLTIDQKMKLDNPTVKREVVVVPSDPLRANTPVIKKISICPNLTVKEAPSTDASDPSAVGEFFWRKAEGGIEGDQLSYSNSVPHEFSMVSNAFCTAYTNHQSLYLDAGDIWVMICLVISEMLEQNAKELGPFLLNDPDKKDKIELCVQFMGMRNENSIWNELLAKTMPMIREHVKPGVVDALRWPHSTKLHEAVSALSVMNGMKHSFSYGGMILGCGLRHVYFSGEEMHWLDMLVRIAKLKMLIPTPKEGETDQKLADIQTRWHWYLDSVYRIIEKFIQTMTGEVDEQWWGSMIDVYRQYVGSGGDYNDWVSGWILILFGKNRPTKTEDLNLPTISVPVKVENRFTKTKYNYCVLGGFPGFTRVDDYWWAHNVTSLEQFNGRAADNTKNRAELELMLCEAFELWKKVGEYKDHPNYNVRTKDMYDEPSRLTDDHSMTYLIETVQKHNAFKSDAIFPVMPEKTQLFEASCAQTTAHHDLKNKREHVAHFIAARKKALTEKLGCTEADFPPLADALKHADAIVSDGSVSLAHKIGARGDGWKSFYAEHLVREEQRKKKYHAEQELESKKYNEDRQAMRKLALEKDPTLAEKFAREDKYTERYIKKNATAEERRLNPKPKKYDAVVPLVEMEDIPRIFGTETSSRNDNGFAVYRPSLAMRVYRDASNKISNPPSESGRHPWDDPYTKDSDDEDEKDIDEDEREAAQEIDDYIASPDSDDE